jgi:hypothetical protein
MLAAPLQAGQPDLTERCSRFCQCGKPPGTRRRLFRPACCVSLHQSVLKTSDADTYLSQHGGQCCSSL